jgi:hypothetical protein
LEVVDGLTLYRTLLKLASRRAPVAGVMTDWIPDSPKVFEEIMTYVLVSWFSGHRWRADVIDYSLPGVFQYHIDSSQLVSHWRREDVTRTALDDHNGWGMLTFALRFSLAQAKKKSLFFICFGAELNLSPGPAVYACIQAVCVLQTIPELNQKTVWS